jgi:hypothetical protein
VVSDLLMYANVSIPANAPDGAYSLAVANAGTQTFLTKPNCLVLTVAMRAIISVNPNKGKPGETLNLRITGSNTGFLQASDLKVTLLHAGSPIEANSVTALSNTTLDANITIPFNAATGFCDVNVWSSIDRGLTKFNGFNITSATQLTPEITDVSPPGGDPGQTLDLTITGRNTHFSQASQIKMTFFGQGSPITVNSLTALSDIYLKANITIAANAQPGTYYFRVTNDKDGTINSPKPIKVNGYIPAIVHVSPPGTLQGTTLDLTITGTHTKFSQASNISVMLFNSATMIEANAVIAMSDSILTANVTIPNDPAAQGLYSIYVSEGFGFLRLDSSFVVYATGVKDEDLFGTVVYPVPASDVLHIGSRVPLDGIVLMNSLGQMVALKEDDITAQGLEYTVRLDRSGLKPGLYYLKMTSGSKVAFRSIQIE